MKKFLVSCEIWLLTFAIYIGSAIYTPGIPGVSEQFGVSNVAAVLGLTLFVLGYGLGMYKYSVLLKLGRVANYSRPDGLVTVVRTAECWSKPNLCPHPGCLCVLPVCCHLCEELWDASCISIPHRLYWLPLPCDRSCIHG